MQRNVLFSRRTFLARAGAAAAALIAVPNTLFSESGKELSPWTGCRWLNKPHVWLMHDGVLRCTADPNTDFWQKTFYGNSADTGHFYHRRVTGDFNTTLGFKGKYRDQYDQAGLMIRVDQGNWMKCGIEFVNGRQNVSVVMTRDYSDWSTALLPDSTGTVWMRVVRKGPALDIFYSLDGTKFEEIRVAYLGPVDGVEIGPMCAAPRGKGFDVEFGDWELKKS